MAMGFALLNIEAEGTPSTALGPKLGMEPTSLSRLLNSMEEKKMIARQTNSQILFHIKLVLMRMEMLGLIV